MIQKNVRNISYEMRIKECGLTNNRKQKIERRKCLKC